MCSFTLHHSHFILCPSDAASGSANCCVAFSFPCHFPPHRSSHFKLGQEDRGRP